MNAKNRRLANHAEGRGGREGQKPFRGPAFRPDAALPKPDPTVKFTPLSDLDLMIANGWGDTCQEEMPDDWRTRRKP